jgi:PTS system nitrogen regulatory IIA component
MDSVPSALAPHTIALDLDIHGRNGLLEVAATLLQPSCRIAKEPIYRALQRREHAGSTAVGGGLAIPHARIPGIEVPRTLFLRARTPIRFRAPDGQPVAEFFVILVPVEGAPEMHLQLLRAVAELFSRPAFRAALAAAQSTAAVAAAFARWSAPASDSELEVLQGLS